MTLGVTPYGGGMFGGGAPAAGAAAATPIVALEVAFPSAPGDTPTWVDISDYLEGHSVSRGRSQETERFGAGTAEIVLANEDRRFDPTLTTSPHYPYVLPMRRVRIRATYASVTYDVFTGYADGWAQEYDPPQVARCRLTATDAFKVLNQIELPSSAYVAEVQADGPVAWWRLGDPSGSTQFLDAAGTNHMTISGAPALGSAGLVARDPSSAVTFAESGPSQFSAQGGTGGKVLGGAPLTIEGVISTTTVIGGEVFNQIATSRNPSGIRIGLGVYFDGLTGRLFLNGGSDDASSGLARTAATGLNNGVPHHWAVTWDTGGAVQWYVDGVEGTTYSTGAPYFGNGVFTPAAASYIGNTFAAGPTGDGFVGTVDEIAVYNKVLTPARIAAHAATISNPWNGELSGTRVNRVLDMAGWPAADREIDAGIAVLMSADLGGSALAALQKIEETEQGRLFVTAAGKVRFISRESLLKEPYVTPEATFGDSGTELEYGDLKYRYDDVTIANEVTVSRLEGKAQTVRDTASQTKYLRRSRVLDGLLHKLDSISIDLGNWILNRYKEPFLRATGMRLEPSAGNAATHYPEVLGRELVDRVTVRRRPQNLGAAIDQDAYVEAIRHQARAMKWRTDWNLSPAPATGEAAVWDGGLWDVAKWGF